MRFLPRTAFSTSLLVLLATGCGLGPARLLEVRGLGQVRVLAATPQAMELEFDLELYNPRRAAARVRDLGFELALGGDFLATGAVAGEVDLPARSVATVRIPAHLPYARVTRDDLEDFLRAEVPYRVRISATLVEPLHRPGLSLEFRGAFKAPDPLIVELEGDSASAFYTWTAVGTGFPGGLVGRGAVRGELLNPFSFPLPVERFAYRLDLRGRPIGEGVVTDRTTLAPGLHPITLPVTLDPIPALGGVIGGVLDGGRLPWVVHGRLVIRSGGRPLDVVFAYRDRPPGRGG